MRLPCVSLAFATRLPVFASCLPGVYQTLARRLVNVCQTFGRFQSGVSQDVCLVFTGVHHAYARRLRGVYQIVCQVFARLLPGVSRRLPRTLAADTCRRLLGTMRQSFAKRLLSLRHMFASFFAVFFASCLLHLCLSALVCIVYSPLT